MAYKVTAKRKTGSKVSGLSKTKKGAEVIKLRFKNFGFQNITMKQQAKRRTR